MKGSEVQPAGAELSARGAVFKAAGVAWPAQAVGSGRRHGSAGAGRPGMHGRRRTIGSVCWFRPSQNDKGRLFKQPAQRNRISVIKRT